MTKEIPYLKEWLDLATSGNFGKAQEIYYEKLFPVIIENFRQSNSQLLPKKGVLFSILGYSPEPIILTAKTVEPSTHVVFTTNSKNEGNEYLERFLESIYEMVYL